MPYMIGARMLSAKVFHGMDDLKDFTEKKK